LRGTEALSSSHCLFPAAVFLLLKVISRTQSTDWIRRLTVVVHCRHGIGRSGMAAACVLVLNGLEPATAIARVSLARGIPIPEIRPQRE
jgi:protein-tyrosine phosphatase